jgi:hypothetical protein
MTINNKIYFIILLSFLCKIFVIFQINNCLVYLIALIINIFKGTITHNKQINT